ncbi:MAG: hypothetical protein V3R86_02650, partial [Candidatus Hydrothermarchaeaceae archaeon]
MKNDKILQGIGAITLLIVIFSVSWNIALASITLNSTSNVDELKLLKISESISGTGISITTNTTTEGRAVFNTSTETSKYGVEIYHGGITGYTALYAIQYGQSDAGFFQRNNASGDRPVLRASR